MSERQAHGGAQRRPPCSACQHCPSHTVSGCAVFKNMFTLIIMTAPFTIIPTNNIQSKLRSRRTPSLSQPWLHTPQHTTPRLSTHPPWIRICARQRPLVRQRTTARHRTHRLHACRDTDTPTPTRALCQPVTPSASRPPLSPPRLDTPCTPSHPPAARDRRRRADTKSPYGRRARAAPTPMPKRRVP